MLKEYIKKGELFLIAICYLFMIGIAIIRPLIVKGIMDKGLVNRNFELIIWYSVSLLIVVILEELIFVFQVNLFENLKKSFVLKLYSKAIKKLLNLKIEYFEKNNSTEIINRLATDINAASIIVDSSVMNLMNYVLQFFGGIIGLFLIKWELALLVMLVVPVKFIMISFFSKKKEALVKELIGEKTEFSAWFGDNIQGIKEIKLWNLYDDKCFELRKRQTKILGLEKKQGMLEAYNSFGDSNLKWVIVVGVYILGGYGVCSNILTLGELTAFITYSNYVIMPISLFFNLKMIFAEIKPSIARLNEFYHLRTEESKEESKYIIKFEDAIRFEHVGFAYGEQRVLKDVSFSIRKGEKVAIIGENGSGKSTIINILLRFIQPKEGSVSLDSVDVEKFDLNLYRELFGVVSQSVHLFHGSIRDNIAMTKTPKEGKFENLCDGLKIDEMIRKFIDGYDCVLENNGKNLSGGERQKIALLRALFKDAQILVLDEATANIDQAYGELVKQYISENCEDKTVIRITHTLDDLKGMDRIYCLKEESIQECKYQDIVEKNLKI